MPYLDYDFIRTIATSVDDDLEADSAVDLPPHGGYDLILLNSDHYRLNTAVGDTLFLRITPMDDIDEALTIAVSDGDGQIVHQQSIGQTTDIQLTCEKPPYLLVVNRNDYGPGGVYRLEYDLKKQFEFANNKIQKGFGWGGMAIVNGEAAACDNIYVVGYSDDGRPLETYIGPFSLRPGEKKVFLTSELPVRPIEKNDLFGIKIMAPIGTGRG